MHVCSIPDGEHVQGRLVQREYIHCEGMMATPAGTAGGKDAVGMRMVGIHMATQHSMPIMGLHLMGMCMAGSQLYSGGHSGANGMEHSKSRSCQVLGLVLACHHQESKLSLTCFHTYA